MTSIEERPNNKDRITKTRNFPWETIEKLGSSKDIDGNSKKSHKKAIWQEKMKFTKTKTRRQHIVWSQKYLIGRTFKEARLEKIWIFWNHKANWPKNVLAKVTRRMNNIQCVQ